MPHLTRDERLRCALLRSLDWEFQKIAAYIGCTERQAWYACQGPPTLKKRSGRPLILSDEQVQEVIEFIASSRTNRRMPYTNIIRILNIPCSRLVLTRALSVRGYNRRIAMRKPIISETNRQKRLSWAIEHKDWVRNDWNRILWTDETWVTGGRHTRTWVTRKAGEMWDDTCVVDRVQRRRGWMFWGCFSGGLGKGPILFWEKEYGKIGAESYMAHTVPLIHGWLRLYPGLTLMQDGAPGHRAAATYEELRSRGICPIEWPPYSPDLNPIERVWHIMKNYLQDNHPEHMSYDQLRVAVKEAWEQVGEAELNALLNSMPTRMAAVIAANGMHTEY